MKIIFVGGETLGSVMPLIAIYEKLKEKIERLDVLWIGTKRGPEERIVKNYLIDYKTITAGKLRRYFSWHNFFDIFKILIGFIKSFFIILTFKPDLIIGAGIFLQAPLMFAGKILNKKILIHQQDRQKSLSNALCEKIASKITVTFKKSLSDFDKNKTIVVGNPYREKILNGDVIKAYKIFKLKQNLPTILILGGGTGARDLNKLIVKSLDKLIQFCQIIHLTGKNKKIDPYYLTNNRNYDYLEQITNKSKSLQHYSNYHQYEFLNDNLKHAYAVADIIISRAGLSTLTELSAIAKPVILIPLPCSHQEENAAYWKKKDGAIALSQKNLTPQKLTETILDLLKDKEKRFHLSSQISKIMPADATERFIKEIIKLIESPTMTIKKW